MKRKVALTLALSMMLVACGKESDVVSNDASTEASSEEFIDADGLGDMDTNFESLSDEGLLQYVEDMVYATFNQSLQSETYIFKNVTATYVSKEEVDELENDPDLGIYFGYSFEEIDEHIDRVEYVITAGDEGKAYADELEEFGDSFNTVVQDVATDNGVVLVNATVSYVQSDIDKDTYTIIFACSAEDPEAVALSADVISGTFISYISGKAAGNVRDHFKSSVFYPQEGFKWGAYAAILPSRDENPLQFEKGAQTESSVPSLRESIEYVLSTYGGEENISFYDREEVNMRTMGATRPDVTVRNPDGTIEAIEVVNTELGSVRIRRALYMLLEQKVRTRVRDLPEDATQKSA